MTRPDRISRRTAAAGLACLALVLALPALSEEGEERPVKEIKMTAENWKWKPAVIRVQKGTLVKIEVQNYDAPHRFDLKQLGLKVNLREGETTKFEFVASKVGEFRWKCGRPCGNGCPKMSGELIVTEGPEAE